MEASRYRFSPASLRPMLVLEAVSEMVTSADWPYKQVRMTLRDQGAEEEFAFSLFGGAKPSTIEEIARGDLHIAMLNPAALLTMAYRGVGVFKEPLPVRAIGVIPSPDRLAFGVAERTGIRTFEELRDRRYPLTVSVRASHDPAVKLLVNQVLSIFGFSLDDIASWGGKVIYDQALGGGPTRIGAFEKGEIDAIFDEAIGGWAGRGAAAGMHFLPLSESQLQQLEADGFRRAVISKGRFPQLPADVPAVDFSGWPIYTSLHAPENAIRAFCLALHARRDRITADGEPLPIGRMIRDTPEGPLEVPLHPVAEQCWRELGYVD
jgi:TRAP-type uncharacterized transport system substrate-binding protein